MRTRKFKTAQPALNYAEKLYAQSIDSLQGALQSYSHNLHGLKKRTRAYYPFIRYTVEGVEVTDSRLSYGRLPQPGIYQTTLTAPKIFEDYYQKQLTLLLENHRGTLEVGVSDLPIPIHFALDGDFHIEKDLSPEHISSLPEFFDLASVLDMDDNVVNGTHDHSNLIKPLALFSAPRIDLSLQRLQHYTGTAPEHFQNFILLTNYSFYIDGFLRYGEESLQNGHGGYTGLVTPNIQHHDDGSARLPQMPAYHLKREGHNGITMINIGVGPSNAKTITDHLAVLRPHAWLMIGHCAGLRNTQRLGDYVLAHGYLREDHVLDLDLPPTIPLPALAEIQISITDAVAEVTGLEGYELKRIVRTGTVATIDDRNWELRDNSDIIRRLSLSRAIALDMESATIAANGFRYRVPYGTLLCVSDRPLHGELKLPGMANSFYRQRVSQHLKIGIRTMEKLMSYPLERLHSRKLRSFSEVAFQ